MFNEINYRDSSIRDWRTPIYYGDHHVKEVWYRGNLCYPLGYLYKTRVTGRINAQIAFNTTTRDVYFSGSGIWKLFPFQASVDAIIKTYVKPAGFMPHNSTAHNGVAYAFDTGVTTGGVLGVDWAWNYIFNPDNVWPVLDTNGNIIGFKEGGQHIETDHILLGQESAQARPTNSWWDDWDVTRGGWEFNTINDVQIMYNFSGDISDAAGSISGTGSWSMSMPSLFPTPNISVDWLQRMRVGQAYSSAFNAHSGQLIKFDAGHRYYTSDGLIFEYWLVHDWYPIDGLPRYWSSGTDLKGVYLRQNGVTGIQVRVYDNMRNGTTGIGGVYFTIPFQNLVTANYNYNGEPELFDRATQNCDWDEARIQKMVKDKGYPSMIYLAPRSGQLPWQKSTIDIDESFGARDGKRLSTADLHKSTNNLYAKDELSLLGTLRQKIIEKIKTQLGVPHLDPQYDVGFDWRSVPDKYWNCSDLVLWCYNEVLYTNYNQNCALLWNKLLEGEEDSDWELVDSLIPGDLIWSVSRGGVAGHVAMLVGTDKAIGALSTGVAQTTVQEQYATNEVYFVRNKLLPSEDWQSLQNKLVLEDVEIQYKESNERTGGSTLYEQRKRAKNFYAIQFISGSGNPLPVDGKISFHIVCENAVDNKKMDSKTPGNNIANAKGSMKSDAILVEAPLKIIVDDKEVDVNSPINATLIIDEIPSTFDLPAEGGYPVKSFTLKTGSSSEIFSNINEITLYPR